MTDMKAIVTKAFPGLPDGGSQVRTFVPGDEVSGDLARVAIENKWAKPAAAAPSDPKAKN